MNKLKQYLKNIIVLALFTGIPVLALKSKEYGRYIMFVYITFMSFEVYRQAWLNYKEKVWVHKDVFELLLAILFTVGFMFYPYGNF